jgi:spermidine synthase
LGTPIFTVRSPYQQIELTKGRWGLSLFLDGYWQFVEKYEHIYHETLVHPAMVCAPGLQRVGIAGGGDALALREVLKYPRLGRAFMYELDPVMLAVADQHPEMLRLNKDAMRHRKACVVAADARKMLIPGANFDVLILDFPSISDGANKFSELYSARFYGRVKQALRPEGVLVVQVTDYPWHLQRATMNLRCVFPYVIPIDIGFRFSMFNFVLASARPFVQRRRLPEGLRFMTQGRINAVLFAAKQCDLVV